MKSIDHALKVTYKGCSDGAEIDMYKHEKGHKETNNYMNKVIHSKSATTQEFG
jgi:hypothetical protein